MEIMTWMWTVFRLDQMKFRWQATTRPDGCNDWGLNAKHIVCHACGGYWLEAWPKIVISDGCMTRKKASKYYLLEAWSK